MLRRRLQPQVAALSELSARKTIALGSPSRSSVQPASHELYAPTGPAREQLLPPTATHL
jgi:hypothetical protein